MKKPIALKPGDTIGIAASSSPFDPAEFQKGVETLKHMGFQVYHRPDIFERKHYLAGHDDRRAAELIELIENPQIKAILFARGGYGMMRLLPFLDRHKFKAKPKIILGYSDLTTLCLYLEQKLGWVSFYGPVVAKDLSSNLNDATRNSLFQALTQKKPLGPFHFPNMFTLKTGKIRGTLVGGCLSLVVASLGTPYEIDTKGKILFLEDTNEKPYAVDRMLTQLVLAGKLKKLKGILLGNFVNGGEPDHFREMAEDVLKDFQGPILFDFPAGHGPTKITLPFGVKVEMDATAKKLEFLEGALV